MHVELHVQSEKQTLVEVLDLYGYSATPAYSVEHALSEAAIQPPDAVVSDVWMRTDGCALARKLITSLAHRPLLVAVTGAAGQAERCWDAGFDHMLLKPADPAALTALLAYLRPVPTVA